MAMEKIIFVAILITFAWAANANCPNCKTLKYGATTCECGPKAAKVTRKYACGPACDAIGSCCDHNVCPSCGNPPYSADESCICQQADIVRRFAKYACGPACDAAGYCCDMPAVTKKPKTETC